jgi:hypothetical protein
MEININTSQIKVLEDFFSNLSNVDQRKIFLTAFRKASVPLINAARQDSPYRLGNLRKSIGTMAVPNEIAILVGAKKSGKPKGWYGHLVENGTVERFRKTKNNASTGRIVGTHFFENAFNMTQEQVYGSIEQEWYQTIDNFIIKTNRKK